MGSIKGPRTTLLSHGDSNTKLKKSNLLAGWLTAGLSLAPADESGTNLCAMSTAGCRELCLFKQGLSGVFPKINIARIRKSNMWTEQPQAFKSLLLYEVGLMRDFAIGQGKRLAVRLNMFSDICWERKFPKIFKVFQDVVFYDYSKITGRHGWIRENYYITWSLSEENMKQTERVLAKGHNAAVVFRKTIPETWKGRRVWSGENDDMRFRDPQGVWVGLTAKGSAKSDTSGFVID